MTTRILAAALLICGAACSDTQQGYLTRTCTCLQPDGGTVAVLGGFFDCDGSLSRQQNFCDRLPVYVGGNGNAVNAPDERCTTLTNCGCTYSAADDCDD